MPILPGVDEYFRKRGEELNPCPLCKGSCPWEECDCDYPCDDCDGTGEMSCCENLDCSMCEGGDVADCVHCDGVGYIGPDDDCKRCDGTGVIGCRTTEPTHSPASGE